MKYQSDREIGSSTQVWMFEYRSLSWWYWLVTASLLTAGVSGWRRGFALALAVTVIQLMQFAIRDRTITAFPVQVRLGYLLLLLIATPGPLQFIYWIPLTGTWALVLFGYCALARVMSLTPWNRARPLSMQLVRQTFLSPPISGSFMQERAPASAAGLPGAPSQRA